MNLKSFRCRAASFFPWAKGGRIYNFDQMPWEPMDELSPEELRRDYLALVPDLRRIANRHGYCLAVHGSMERDLDVVCAVFHEEFSIPELLIEAFCAFLKGTLKNTEEKPHGRFAWVIAFGGGRILDASIIAIGVKVKERVVYIESGSSSSYGGS